MNTKNNGKTQKHHHHHSARSRPAQFCLESHPGIRWSGEHRTITADGRKHDPNEPHGDPFFLQPNDRQNKNAPSSEATHLARRDKDNGAIHHHDHKAHAPTQLHRRWCCPPPVAVCGGLFEVESAVADGRSSSGRGRPEARQQNVASSRHARRRSLLRDRCPHRIINSALLRASPPAG